eukprot:505467-Rhodomonas_salina.2
MMLQREARREHVMPRRTRKVRGERVKLKKVCQRRSGRVMCGVRDQRCVGVCGVLQRNEDGQLVVWCASLVRHATCVVCGEALELGGHRRRAARVGCCAEEDAECQQRERRARGPRAFQVGSRRCIASASGMAATAKSSTLAPLWTP